MPERYGRGLEMRLDQDIFNEPCCWNPQTLRGFFVCWDTALWILWHETVTMIQHCHLQSSWAAQSRHKTQNTLPRNLNALSFEWVYHPLSSHIDNCPCLHVAHDHRSGTRHTWNKVNQGKRSPCARLAGRSFLSQRLSENLLSEGSCLLFCA